MAVIGTPPPVRSTQTNTEYSVLHGIRSAIEVLSKPTDIQLEKQSSADNQNKLQNRCRVIVVTSARDDESMKRLEEIFHNNLVQQNKAAANSDRLFTVDYCHLVIINTYPINIDSPVTSHPPKSVSKSVNYYRLYNIDLIPALAYPNDRSSFD